MKLHYILFFISFLFQSTAVISRETGPVAHSSIVSIGTDVTIEPDTNQDKRDIRLASANNGWIYAAYQWGDANVPVFGGLNISLSRDSGLTWQQLVSIPFSHAGTSLEGLLVTGSDTTSFEVYVAYTYIGPAGPCTTGNVNVYDGATGSLRRSIALGDHVNYDAWGCNSIAIVSDFGHASFGSNPYSVGIFYTTTTGTSTSVDSVISLISLDGGLTFGTRKVLDSAGVYYHITADHGYSTAWTNGRYFVTYESSGHVAYTRNTSSISGNWLPPQMLDMIVPGFVGTPSRPEIICQHSSSNNDSTGLSVLIMMYYDNLYYEFGIFNMKALSTNNWLMTDPAPITGGTYPFKAYVCFDQTLNTFRAIYPDQGLNSLVSTEMDFNFHNAAHFRPSVSLINDDPIFPDRFLTTDRAYAIAENRSLAKSIFAWITHQPLHAGDSIGVAKFDLENILTSTVNLDLSKNSIGQNFPNPVSGNTSISYTVSETDGAIFNIYSVTGEKVYSEKINSSSGSIHISTEHLNDGIYFYNISKGNIPISRMMKMMLIIPSK